MPCDIQTKNEREIDPYPGLLLLVFDRVTRVLWDWSLIQTGTWFQGPGGSNEHAYISRRDRFALATLLASILSFGLLYLLPHLPARYSTALGAFLGALASYQIFGLAIVVIRLALLGVTRGLAATRDYPDSRIRRLLLLALMNYMEFIFWFAVLYCSLASAHPGFFSGDCKSAAGS